ncbi:MAG: fatty acid desaturase [Planctomycetota bacterium]
METQYPIPNKLNGFLLILFFFAYLVLLWVASHVESRWDLAGITLAFTILMIPIYSLLHESTHGILFSSPRWNEFFGLLLAAMFWAPFTFLRRIHVGHHRKNRTDFEIFDLYYPQDSRSKKIFFLYFNMIGIHWLSLPLSVFIFFIWPPLLRNPLFLSSVSIASKVEDITPEWVPRIRLESVGVLFFQGLLFWGLSLRWEAYLTLFLFHALIWSSQNYVNHAFSPRDILKGAHNHSLGPITRRLYLNFNCHLAHHQYPTISWKYLPHLVEPDPKRISYWKAWLRLWKGPIAVTESSPRGKEEFFQNIPELQ